MISTAEEAARRWCPFSGTMPELVAPTAQPADAEGPPTKEIKKPPGDAGQQSCVGPLCMAWRWVMVDQAGPECASFYEHGNGRLAWPKEGGRVEGSWTMVAPPTAMGYCGLAGRPGPSFK